MKKKFNILILLIILAIANAGWNIIKIIIPFTYTR